MAHHTIIYGRINGAYKLTRDNIFDLHNLNSNIINNLPENEPYINRSMFSIPNKHGVFRDQIITFGASYKTFEYKWHIWLEKFEAILKQLYWYDVIIHADFEVFGQYTYEWSIDIDQVFEKWHKDDPELILDWEYKSDGPRSFLDKLYPNLRK